MLPAVLAGCTLTPQQEAALNEVAAVAPDIPRAVVGDPQAIANVAIGLIGAALTWWGAKKAKQLVNRHKEQPAP